jgi:hypothetical protein
VCLVEVKAPEECEPRTLHHEHQFITFTLR